MSEDGSSDASRSFDVQFFGQTLTIVNQEGNHVTMRSHGTEHLVTKRSLYVFSAGSKFRQVLIWISQWPVFDRFILLLILLNSLFLALQDYSFRLNESNKNWRNILVEEAEIYFLCFFTIEAILKIIAKGFIIGKWAYLKEAWNVLDFLVVVFGWLTFIPGIFNFSVLRTIRVLRPLKSVKKIPSLRKMVRSLFRSLPALANVVIFLGFVFFILGIIGVNSLKGGLYQRCRYTKEPDGSSWLADPDIKQLWTLSGYGLYSCPDDRYCGLPGQVGLFDYDFYREAEIPELQYGIINFDNLASAWLAIFQVSTLEGWSKIMYDYYGSHSPLLLSLYFSVMVIFVSFFILNLMLGAIWSSFRTINNEDQLKKSECDDNLDWSYSQEQSVSLLSDSSPDINADEILEIPQNYDKQEKRAPFDRFAELRREESQIQPTILSETTSQIDAQANMQTNDPRIPRITTVICQQSVQEEDELQNPSISLDEDSFSYIEVNRSLRSPQDAIWLASFQKMQEPKFDSKWELEKNFTVYMSKLRLKVLYIVQSWWFGAIINVCIIINTIILALNRYPIPEKETKAYEIANLVFFGIFFIEMVLKLAALHPRRYIQDRFDVFDGIIVILSSIEIILFYTGVEGDGGSIIIVFRAFRLLRVFKLAKKWTELSKLMETIFKCLQDVFYFGVLLILFMFIYALIGMELYAYKLRFSGDEVDLQDGISHRENFDDFLHAFVSVFIALVGDDWQYLMYDAIRAQGYFSAVLYFLSLFIIGNVILINICISILFDNFEQKELEEKAQISLKARRRTRLDTVLVIYNKQSVSDNHSQTFSQTSSDDNKKGNSLFIFGNQNRLRLFLLRIVKSKLFEYIIFIIIVISSILLAIDNPLNDPESELSIALYWIDMIVSCIFILEATIKMIANGFYWAGPNSYLRDGWNVLDFVIAILSILSISTSTDALGKLKTFRTFRVLKPLRFISKMKNLRLSINTFLKSIPAMINVLIMTFLFALVLGIVCVNQLKGALYYCDLDEVIDTMPSQIKTQQDWLNAGGLWVNKESNFDNAAEAILTLYIAATKEGWAQIMYSAVDAVGIGKQPQFEHQIGWIFFFIVIVTFGNFFVFKLLTGIVIDKFNMENAVEQGITFLSKPQREYAMIRTYMLNYRPIVVKRPPENLLRKYWFYISENKIFDGFIMICIILNSIVIALNWYEQPQISIYVFDIMNRVFIVIFLLEGAIKITAYLGKYFKSGYNIFDFFIVFISIIELLMERFANAQGFFLVSFFRIFRIGRVLRLEESSKQLRVFVGTFVLSLPQVCNIGALILLFMYVFTVLGVQLFAKVRVTGAMNEYANFQEFWKAFMLLLRCSSGEAWNELMFAAAKSSGPNYDCVDDPTYEQIQDNDGEPNGCGTGWSYFYFISFLLLVAFVGLNLFIAVIIQQFDVAYAIENGQLNGRAFEKFWLLWSKYDPQGTGFIAIPDFSDFLATLDPPLGLRNCDRAHTKQLMRHIKFRELNVFQENTYHFYEVSNALASYSYTLPGTVLQPETTDIWFQKIEKVAKKRWPVLNMTNSYNSRHMHYLIRIQRHLRQILTRIRERRINDEYQCHAPYGTPEELCDVIDEAGTQDLEELRK